MGWFNVEWFDFSDRISARSASAARYAYWLRLSDCYDVKFGDFLRVAKVQSCGAPPPDPEVVAVERFNAECPVGTRVLYWTWTREGMGKLSRTRTIAQMVSGNAVVWIEDHPACISLTHIEPIPASAEAAA